MAVNIFNFGTDPEIQAKVSAKYGIPATDTTAIMSKIQSLSSEHQDDLASCQDDASYKLGLISIIDSDASVSAPAPAADPAATLTSMTSAKAKNVADDLTKSAAAEALKERSAAIQADAANTFIVGICTTKPALKDRLNGVTKVHIKTSPSLKKKLEEYAAKVPADQKAQYEAVMAEYNKAESDAGYETEIYINKDARPVVAGYKWVNPNAKNEGYFKKNKDVLLSVIALRFGGLLKENEYSGKPTLGATLREVKVKGYTNVKDIRPIITGTSEYWNDNPDGIKTYEVDGTALDKVTVRSALGFAIEEVKEGKTTRRTVRLSGQVEVPKLKRSSDFVDAFGEISAGIGASKASDMNPETAHKRAADALATMFANNNAPTEATKAFFEAIKNNKGASAPTMG